MKRLLSSMIYLTVATMAWVLCGQAALALPLQGTIRIVAPSGTPLAGAVGHVSNQGGMLVLEDLLAPGGAATVSLAVDKGAGTASEDGAALDVATLKGLAFGSIAAAPRNLGALAFVADRLPTEAKLLRRTTFEGHQVELYFFRQDRDHFGEVYYSPLYAFPLKIDSYDAIKDQRTMILVEAIR